MDDVFKQQIRRIGGGAALLALLAAWPVGRAEAAAVKVPCDAAALASAIADANTAGVAKIKLPSKCIVAVTTPATADEAFPIVTGDVTIVGKKGTVLARDPSVADFRLFTVASGGTLRLKKVALKQGTTAGLGGAVLVNGTLTAERVTFSDNTAGNGGAISVTADGTASVNRSAFVLNGTTGVGGGGVLNSGALTVTRSSFVNNSGPINGGAINTQGSGTTTVVKCTIGHNRSGGLGGALSNLGTLVVERSTLFSNVGTAGGAIATGNENVTLDHVRIEDNVPDNCSPLNTIDGCVDPVP